MKQMGMQKYVLQLLGDIAYARENISWPFVKLEVDLQDWITSEKENWTAPVCNL